MTLTPGTTVGRYQILEPLGQGGMATVYKAFQPSLEREVALKVLRPGYAQDAEFRERFEREAKSIAKLRHPNIVQVFDFEISPSGEYVLAMELLEGGTLKDRLARLASEGRRIDRAEAVRILWEVADALTYAHEAGVVHRDVKPSNVMLARPRDRAVVTDFGIARILGATSHTQTGVGIGTPEYMAPEQGQGTKVDHRADIYSLGAMAYELLTGRVPFTADTPLAVVIAHIKDPLPLPTSVDPTIPPAIERALLRALAKDPAARYESAVAFAEALKAGLSGGAAGETTPTIIVRGADAAAPAHVTSAAAVPAATDAPARPATVTIALPPILTRPSVIAGASMGLVAAIVAGVIVSGAVRTTPVAPSAPTASAGAASLTPAATLGGTFAAAAFTPAPTASKGPPKFAIPAKGPLIYEAPLDGNGRELRGDLTKPCGPSVPLAAKWSFPVGAIQVDVPEGGSIPSSGFRAQGCAQVAATLPDRARYVLELDFSVSPDSELGFFTCTLTKGSCPLQMNFSTQDQSAGFYTEAPAPDPHIRIDVPGMLTGKAFTLALVSNHPTYELYVDQKLGGKFSVPTDLGTPSPTQIAVFGNSGSVRILGIRYYALP